MTQAGEKYHFGLTEASTVREKVLYTTRFCLHFVHITNALERTYKYSIIMGYC